MSMNNPPPVPIRTLFAAVISLLLINVCFVAAAVVVVPVSCMAAHYLRPEPQWAVEHQTNVAGKDVIIRCRGESFCPIPDDLDNDGSSLVDNDTDTDP